MGVMILKQLETSVSVVHQISGYPRDIVSSSYRDDKLKFSFHDVIVPAGTFLHVAGRYFTETVYCIEGRGEVERIPGKEVNTLEPGSLLIMYRNEEHYIRAMEDMRMMIMYEPPLPARDLLETDEVEICGDILNIFVIGLNDFNIQKLSSIRNADRHNFIKLLDAEDVLEREDYPLHEIIEKAGKEIRRQKSTHDGIIHYIDFPVSTIVPLLGKEFGFRTSSLESVLKCEHKYWSRFEQKRIIPEHVPLFQAFDPFEENVIGKIEIKYPFWVKPVKSFSSYLGFRINNKSDFILATSVIKRNIGRFSDPFNYMLDMVDKPEEVSAVNGGYCIAEDIIGGRQCTQEGFSFNGKIEIYATIDSFREPYLPSFSSYQYPSILPPDVQKRMTVISKTIMEYIAYDNAPFNIEYFWDMETNRIWLLEINPRISESHCDLFEKVDGSSSHQVAVELALGIKPSPQKGKGEYNCAAKFFVRSFEDAMVTRVPSSEEIQHIEEELVPGSIIKIKAIEGKRLSEMMDQDSYSYNTAIVFIGAGSKKELDEKYRLILDNLHFSFST